MNKIYIHPKGSRKTNHQVISQLKQNTPDAFGLAKKILVTAAKYRKGGGLLKSKKKRGKQLEKRIYRLEEALKTYRFGAMIMHSRDPVKILFGFFSIVSEAFPNWQNEYALLNDFIPSCTKYKGENIT